MKFMYLLFSTINGNMLASALKYSEIMSAITDQHLERGEYSVTKRLM